MLAQENDAKKFAFDSIEYGRRAATEREIGDTTLISPESKNVTNQKIELAFDETGRLLLYPTLVGIKVSSGAARSPRCQPHRRF